ncbi:DNA-directed RNA polymerase subunit omega [Candidatus Aerophobetes bacterium]|nr:DNA-directed RNA polymerase subunit omega [Candidatus Aerophobetes bacterium]
MERTGIKDKFALVRFAIKRAKQLIKEKDKRALLESEKVPVSVLKELQQGNKKDEEVL